MLVQFPLASTLKSALALASTLESAHVLFGPLDILHTLSILALRVFQKK